MLDLPSHPVSGVDSNDHRASTGSAPKRLPAGSHRLLAAALPRVSGVRTRRPCRVRRSRRGGWRQRRRGDRRGPASPSNADLTRARRRRARRRASARRGHQIGTGATRAETPTSKGGRSMMAGQTGVGTSGPIVAAQPAEWLPARTVLLCEPGIETLFAVLETDAANFLRPFNLLKGRSEHRRFRDLLRSRGAEVIDLREALTHGTGSDEAALARLRRWAHEALTYEAPAATPRETTVARDAPRGDDRGARSRQPGGRRHAASGDHAAAERPPPGPDERLQRPVHGATGRQRVLHARPDDHHRPGRRRRQAVPRRPSARERHRPPRAPAARRRTDSAVSAHPASSRVETSYPAGASCCRARACSPTRRGASSFWRRARTARSRLGLCATRAPRWTRCISTRTSACSVPTSARSATTGWRVSNRQSTSGNQHDGSYALVGSRPFLEYLHAHGMEVITFSKDEQDRFAANGLLTARGSTSAIARPATGTSGCSSSPASTPNGSSSSSSPAATAGRTARAR